MTFKDRFTKFSKTVHDDDKEYRFLKFEHFCLNLLRVEFILTFAKYGIFVKANIMFGRIDESPMRIIIT